MKHISLFVIAILAFLVVYSCGKTKETTKLHSVTASKSSSIFLKGAAATQDESYSHIVNNAARLRAMLTGSFVQYNTGTDPQNKKFKVWTVNDGKDSVVVYQIPVGDFQKVGHWMYQYQIMTSLPDEPIYEAFSKLVEISRDSIQEIYYDAPADFNVPLAELLKNPDAAFAKVNLSKLQPSPDPEHIMYVRQSPLFFIGYSPMILDPEPRNKDGYKIMRYEIKPQLIAYTTTVFDKNKKELVSNEEHLHKLSMMKADAPK